MREPIIRIKRMASPEERLANPQYEGFDENSGILFYGEPGYSPKYYFMYNKVQYTVFRAKESRLNGVYLGQPNGQVSLVRIEREGFDFYQIVSGEKPFFLKRSRRTLPSGKIQVYGVYYFPSSDILIHY